MSYQNLIIPVASVARRHATIKRAIEKYCKPDDATTAALVASVDFAVCLVEAGAPPTACFGLIKETKDYGNTSVSMGLAALSGLRPGEVKRFLNAGTGPAKHQAYLRTARGTLVVFDEYKPDDVPSIQTAVAATEDQTKKLQDLIGVALDTHQSDLAADAKEAGLALNPIVEAFVTGTERGKWDKGTPEQRAELDGIMARLFAGVPTAQAPVPWRSPLNAAGSFFMPQEVEGTLELTACKAMYANLAEEKLIDADAEVVGSFGIGRGSCQLAVSAPDGGVVTFGYGFGMDKPGKLPEMAGAIVGKAAEYGLDKILRGRRPVIALKSGALLALEANAELKGEVLAIIAAAPVATPDVAVVQLASLVHTDAPAAASS